MKSVRQIAGAATFMTAVLASGALSAQEIGVGIDLSYPWPQFDLCYNAVNNEFLAVYAADGPSVGGGGNFALVARRIDPETLAPIGEATLIESSGAPYRFPCVAWAAGPDAAGNRNRYMVAYRDGNSCTLRAWFLNSDGSIDNQQESFGGPFPVVPLGMQGGWQGAVDIDSDGTRFMVVWIDLVDGAVKVVARQLGMDYVALQDPGLGPRFDVHGPLDGAMPDYVSISHLAGAASAYLVAYADTNPQFIDPPSLQNSVIKARVVTPTPSGGTVASERAISADAPFRWRIWPRIAANLADQEWLVVWEETNCDPWGGNFPFDPLLEATGDILFRRVDAAGDPVESAPVALQSGPALDFAPHVSWSADQDRYSILWQRGSTQEGASIIMAALVAGGSGTISKNGLQVTDPQSNSYSTPFPAAGAAGDILALSGMGFDEIGLVLTSNRPRLSVLEQLQWNGITPLARGGRTKELRFVARAYLSHVDPDETLSFEVEVRPVDEPFTSPSTIPPDEIGVSFHDLGNIPARSTAVLSVPGLILDTEYHWQARAVDSGNRTTPWIRFTKEPSAGDFDFVAKINLPPGPASVGQFDSTTGLALPLGRGLTDVGALLIRGTAADGDDDPVRLEVEVRPVGIPLSGTATDLGPQVEGGPVEVAVHPLGQGRYTWQSRVVDSWGAAGEWTPFGGNAPDSPDFEIQPPSAEAVGQFDPATGVALPLGRVSYDVRSILVRGVVANNDGYQVRLEVEIRPVGIAFSNTATDLGPFIAGGPTEIVSRLLPPGQYHWQFRAVDAGGGAGLWTGFGGNSDAADFVVHSVGSQGVRSCAGSSATGSLLSPLFIFVLAPLVLVSRR